jgi:hypothetical protein
MPQIGATHPAPVTIAGEDGFRSDYERRFLLGVCFGAGPKSPATRVEGGSYELAGRQLSRAAAILHAYALGEGGEACRDPGSTSTVLLVLEMPGETLLVRCVLAQPMSAVPPGIESGWNGSRHGALPSVGRGGTVAALAELLETGGGAASAWVAIGGILRGEAREACRPPRVA